MIREKIKILNVRQFNIIILLSILIIHLIQCSADNTIHGEIGNSNNTTTPNVPTVVISPSVATTLSFSLQPSNIISSVVMTPAIKVQVLDTLGNVVTSSNANISLTLVNNPGSATLQGTLTQTASAGESTFNNISLNAIGTGYTIQATSPGLTSVTSNSFNVTTAPSLFGKVTTNFGTGYVDYAYALQIQSDGKILAAGISNANGSNDFAVVRYLTSGSLDTSFGTGGKVKTDIGTGSNDDVNALQIQSDGKILVAGLSNANGTDDFTVVRYLTTGSLDTSFGTGGKVLTDIGTGSTDYASAMQVQSDGKILVAGQSNANGTDDFTLVRYLTTGSLDTSFGTGGKVSTDIGVSSIDVARALQIQSDGKILVAGSSNANGTNDFTVVRYLSTGALDTSFGIGGKVLTDIGVSSADEARALQIQSDGKILVAGYSDASGSIDFTVVRYLATGVLDTSFGTGGKVTTDIVNSSNDYVRDMQIQSDGKILVTGFSTINSNFNFTTVRYLATGVLDSSFGTLGKVTTDIGSSTFDEAFALQIQSDGKLLAAGYSNANGNSSDFTVVRYLTTGALDTSFGGTGKVLTDIGKGTDDHALALKIQSDGKLLAAGYSNVNGSYDFALVRYLTTGALDTSFGTGGKALTDIGTGSNDEATALAIQSDGKILVAGSSSASGNNDFTVVRYLTTGTLDTSFGTGGKVTTDIGIASDDQPSAIQIQSDGKILVAGSTKQGSNNQFAVVRYLTTGALDTSFGTGGKVTTSMGPLSDDTASALQIQSDGKILVAGQTYDGDVTITFALVRYNSNGSLDTTFNSTGKVITGIGLDTGGANDLQIQSDGKILLAGQSWGNGNYDFTVVRYLTTGAVDTTFGSGGKVLADIGTGSNDFGYAMQIQSDGKILVAGQTNANGSVDFTVVRFLTTGALDNSFGINAGLIIDIGTGSNDSAHALQIQSDGKILFAGLVTIFDSDFAIIRLDTSGVLN